MTCPNYVKLSTLTLWLWYPRTVQSNRRGQAGDPQLLGQEMRMIGPNAFCALALGAEGPLLSALEKFPEEFEAYVASQPTAADGGETEG